MSSEIEVVAGRNPLVDGAIAGPELPGRAKIAEAARIGLGNKSGKILGSIDDVPFREAEIGLLFGKAVVRQGVDLGAPFRIDYRHGHRAADIGRAAAPEE